MNRPRTKVREDRTIPLEIEARASDDGKPIIDGYALRYGAWSQDLGGFVERILPGAATRTIGEADVRALINHDPSLLLARNNKTEGDGALVLTDDGKGVRNIFTPTDTSYARDLIVNMREGVINQQSFAFTVPGRRSDSKEPADVWREPGHPENKHRDLWERDIHELRLFDVSIVTYPAYTGSRAHVRSDARLMAEYGLDTDNLADIFVRADRGLSITDTDRERISAAITVLRSYLEPAPAPVSDDVDATRADEAIAERVQAAGLDVAHLRRIAEGRQRTLGLVTGL